MPAEVFPKIRVSLDIACRLHSVAIGLADVFAGAMIVTKTGFGQLLNYDGCNRIFNSRRLAWLPGMYHAHEILWRFRPQ